MAKKKINNSEPSPFKQDLAGILLIALSIFILVSNFSSSTGLVGLYIVKLALRSILGIGIYFLPFFIGLYGVIMLFRHEIKELRVRLTGLFILFISFIAYAQFYAPIYFKSEAKYLVVQGAGGFIGFCVKFLLERTIGFTGSYILLFALGLTSVLMISNITAVKAFLFIKDLFTVSNSAKNAEKKKDQRLYIPEETKTIAAQMPLIKDIPKEVVSFPSRDQTIFESETIDTGLEPEITIVEETAEKQKNNYSKYRLPSLDLLDDSTSKEKERAEKSKEATEMRKKLLEETLRSFGVEARVVSINQGPAVTRYELQPGSGVKVSRIANLSDDIALNLAAQGVRIEAPVPGKSVVGIEVPNTVVTPVRLKEIIKTNDFQRNNSKIFVGLGKDLAGMPIYGDLAKMPHLLIAGTTGSGKSVCVNSLIVSILMRARPDEVKFIMIDPKMVELNIYNDIPHLLAPVVTEARQAAMTLKFWVIKEMENRYRLFHDSAARNIYSYNSKVAKEERLPYIVVIIDELADLMMVAAAEVETTICRLAQLARATGIHLVIATQRPSVDVITGLIKANIPSRIAFAVATQIDSRVILDSAGAEKLLGRGDMLYNPIGAMKPVRLQGSFVTDKETEKVIRFIKAQAAPDYLEEISALKIPGGDNMSLEGEDLNGRDKLFAEAAKLIIETQVASTSFLQRRMRIGYNRAARLMDEIEAAGIVSKPEGDNKPRRIIGTRESLKNTYNIE
ncbi:MAG: DNA segregation ATPase FtsK/SpoIIIE S-DNA-T family [Candidatus Saganbacteria bacterium]|uniref:DNA segregation ATPase FtsK/SpoIIIE S-DNA-T family n=1 Tax=Candidatus Saganbacteria bacterium TaxID=2575572 RepID=A0A833NZJ4_UNCSA|nr:MAG: DNA segregation ATPase FtsK/SpoIIIE S-DNA-T family [Candidatus Saganbacteria bacterium]